MNNLNGSFDFVTKADKTLTCFSCKRKIKKGEYVGYVSLVPFCLKNNCAEETKRITFYMDTDSIMKKVN